MITLRDMLRQRALWIGFSAAFVPLLFLLGLQYWWLTRLEETSVLAGKAVLASFLDAVTTEIAYAYGPGAERALDVPAPFFVDDEHLFRAGAHFDKRGFEGARRHFVVRFVQDEPGTTLFHDPATKAIAPAAASAESRAVTVACAPWKLLHAKAVEMDTARLTVEERDPENRIILAPVLDRGSRVVGVAGLILDQAYFRETLLPRTVAAALQKFFPGSAAKTIEVTVRDGKGRTWLGPASEPRPDASRPLTFVFTDLRLGVRSRDTTPEQLAHASFASNLALSVLAAVLLTGGVGLALRTASREVKLSRMKSDFVSNVSHELRTPLASIRVFAEFLRLGRAASEEKVREYGAQIESESRRLTQLIDNILDFARIESGERLYSFRRGDVASVVSSVVASCEPRWRQEGFEVALDIPDEPVPAVIDADALGQAVLNLLDNAVKYSGTSRWIRVALHVEDGEVVIAVTDRGIGIPAEELPRVFDRFHRVGTGLVHNVRGSGLGLSIVQHIVQAHGGRLRVESAVGRGSCFEIRLPADGREPS